MTPPIAILGAGPSGLALARFLEVADIDYVIFEREESGTWASGKHGSGTLDIHEGSGQLVLREAGLLDEFKSLARCDATNALADWTGKVYFKSENGHSDRPEIDRRDLRAMLLRSIPTNKICWGKRVQHVWKESDGSMAVHFTDGDRQSGFRLIVGADGAWSKARNLITSAKPQYSGYHFLTSTIKPDNPFHSSAAALAGTGNYGVFGRGRQIAVQKLGEGSYYVAFGLALPENWSSENVALFENSSALRQKLLENYFADWPQVHTDLIKHSDGDFRAWPLYAMPTESLAWESVAGITLIGDAAHVTTPFVGEGVNCAMYDSFQLGQQIVKHGLDNLNHAVVEYEKFMFPRAIDLIQRSKESGDYLFADDAPRGWLKHFAGIDSD